MKDRRDVLWDYIARRSGKHLRNQAFYLARRVPWHRHYKRQLGHFPRCLSLQSRSRSARGAIVPTDRARRYRSPANQRIRHLSQNGVVVDPSQVGPKVSTAVLGATAEVWFDIAKPGLAASFEQAGMATTRWPGGHGADRYHWRTNKYSRRHLPRRFQCWEAESELDVQ